MSAQVYIVMGTTGEYSDRSEWPVAAFESERVAEEHVRLASQWLEQNYDRTKRYSPEYYKWLKSKPNPYDPDMQIDYTGTEWFVCGPVPVISADPSTQQQDGTNPANGIPEKDR